MIHKLSIRFGGFLLGGIFSISSYCSLTISYFASYLVGVNRQIVVLRYVI